MLSTIGLRGHVTMHHRDAAGRLLGTYENENLVVTAGLAWLAGCLSGDNADATIMKYVGSGTGSTAPDAANTTLGTEVESRATGTTSRTTVTVANDTYQVVGTVSMTGTHAITESGLFSLSSGGTMLARQTFAAINVVSGDSIQFTWKVTFSAV